MQVSDAYTRCCVCALPVPRGLRFTILEEAELSVRLGDANLRWWIRDADGRIMVVRCHGCSLAESLRRILRQASAVVPRNGWTRERIRGLLDDYEGHLERVLDEYEEGCEASRRYAFGGRFTRPTPASWAEEEVRVYGMGIRLTATPPPVSEDGPLEDHPPLPPGWNATWSGDERAWYYWHDLRRMAQWEFPGTRDGAVGPPGARTEGAQGAV